MAEPEPEPEERDEFEDSRTAVGGRKRDLQESSGDTLLDEFPGAARKRVKADVKDVLVINSSSVTPQEPSISAIEDKLVDNPRSADENRADLPHTSQIKKSVKQPSMTWNSSIHGGLGLRTSFGSNHLVERLATSVTNNKAEPQGTDDQAQLLSNASQIPSPARSSPDSGNRLRHKRDASLTESPSESESESEAEAEIRENQKNDESSLIPETQPWLISGTFKMLDGKTVTELPRNSRRLYRRAQKAYLKQANLTANTALVDSLFAQGATWPLDDDEMSYLVSAGKTLYPRQPTIPLKFRSWNIPSPILHDDLPIKGPDFSLDIYALSFLTENMDGLDKITSKVVQQSFKYYVQSYYSHIGSPALQILIEKFRDSFDIDDACCRARVFAMRGFHLNEMSGRGNSIMKNVDKAMTLSPDRLVEHVAASKVSQRMSDAELLLQEKYYPSSTIGAQPCLVCARTGHRWSECPALSCEFCGASEHSNLMCPHRKRCDKCRERGHSTLECSQKLSLAVSEYMPCDVCGSREHIEENCHYIWRTFDPRPEEILKVRDITVFCYTCGARDHYGTECGLNTALQLSGEITWSRANLQRYVDPNSLARALSAGADYSIPPKAFSIKGKASAPERIEHNSDGDEDFIRPKVPVTQPGHIRFDGYRSFPGKNQFEGSRFGSTQLSASSGPCIEQINSIHNPRTFSGHYTCPQESVPPAKRDFQSSQSRGNEASQRDGLRRRGKNKHARAVKQRR